MKRRAGKSFLFLFFIFMMSFYIMAECPSVLADSASDISTVTNSTYSTKYSQVLQSWSEVPDAINAQQVVAPSEFTSGDFTLLTQEESYGYSTRVAKLDIDQSITLNVTVQKTALYTIQVDYYDLSTSILAQEASVLINGEEPFYESSQLVFPMKWIPNSTDFLLDRYHNEIVPQSDKEMNWQNTYLIDGTYLNGQPLKFKLTQGTNTITITSKTGDLLIGNVSLNNPTQSQSYEDYLAQYQDVTEVKTINTVEAEYISSKNDASITIYSDTDPKSTHYNTRHKLLNAIAPNSWQKGGQTITWAIDVDQTGLYKLAFKYQQYSLVDLPVYRSVSIDGAIPFQEMESYPFQYAKNWTNETLHNDNGAYEFYLTEGTHYLSMSVTLDPYRPIIEEINKTMQEMNSVSLNIKKLTGNKVDQYRDWNITDYMPNLSDTLNAWADALEVQYQYGNSLNNTKKAAGQLLNLKLSISKLRSLAKDPNQLPNKMTQFTDGSSSVAEFLGDQMLSLINQPLGLEKIYVYNQESLPHPRANFFLRTWEGVKRFVYSFFPEDYNTKTSGDEIEVWVNRPRQYIELMQQMIDSEFTPQMGVKVKLSVMPDENKLVLAAATGTAPDVALGVDNWIPYNLAIRGALTDLRQFDGYKELVQNFEPGAMIPYVYSDGMYGLPETQDFWVTFYRTDIFNQLNLPLPNTWQDLIDLLPQLQRQGLNFYDPLALYDGLKPFNATLPYFYQFGSKSLYSEDGLTTTLDSESNIQALKFMTDLFTIYDVPESVPNFYNHFRFGDLPIGIGNLSTYIQLTVAAPEIKGNWSIAVQPGVEDANGNVARWAPVGGQSAIEFANTKHSQESFDFINWWLSTKTQSEFALNLQTMYGDSYLWISANINAFETLPIPLQDKKVILQQWEWAMEASRNPGYYMVEREISNAWSSIVYGGKNVRTAINDAVTNSNREIKKQFEDFQFIKGGVLVEPYTVPTIDNISNWLTQRKDG